jgi:hypothetical protein
MSTTISFRVVWIQTTTLKVPQEVRQKVVKYLHDASQKYVPCVLWIVIY